MFHVVQCHNKKLLMHLSANIIIINIITVVVPCLKVTRTITTIRLFKSTVLKKIVIYCLSDLVEFPLLKCNIKGKMALFHNFINVLRLTVTKDIGCVSNP